MSTPCCDRPACVRTATIHALREITYPLIPPVRLPVMRAERWVRKPHGLLVAWGVS